MIRAIHEWCSDNGFTPYLAVAVDARTRVPMEFVRDGQIVLNIGLDATHRLQMGNDLIEFQARFGGVARDISVPVACVAAIYARENGAGMAFEVEADDGLPETSEDASTTLSQVGLIGVPSSSSTSSPDSAPDSTDSTDSPEPTPPPAGRPRLQRVK